MRFIHALRGRARPARRRSAVEDHYAKVSVESLQRTLEDEENAEDVSLSVLLQAATLRAPQLDIAPDKRDVGEAFFPRLNKKWKQASQGELAVFPPIAIVAMYRKPTTELRISLSTMGAPEFDWSMGRELLNAIDAITRLATNWLPEASERAPHFERAFGLATEVLGAVQRERWRRERGSILIDAPAAEAFLTQLGHVRERIDDALKALEISATEHARDVYIRGMLLGAVGLAVLVGIGAYIFHANGLPAVDGIAFPAGALGAVIGVLTRLTSLEIDYRAPTGRLLLAGAGRPLLGGVFGYAVYALLQAQLLGETLVQPPQGTGAQLAFYGIFGFLAGFSERFAQDVVTSSARRLGAALG